MTAKELRTKSAVELQAELDTLGQEYFSLRMQNGTQQLTQSHQLKNVRRNIARVKTIMHEKKADQK